LQELNWLKSKPAQRKKQKFPWAPINSFFNAHQTAKPDNATGGSPNPNLLYSVAWLDLGPEPIVLHVPEITDRYYCMQMACMDSDNFAYVGNRNCSGCSPPSVSAPGKVGRTNPNRPRADWLRPLTKG
jgi:hypothetical protein